MNLPTTPSGRALLSACMLSAAGALVFNAFPLFLSTLANQFHLNDEQMGLLGTTYLGGALGPGVAGAIVERNSFDELYMVVCAVCGVSAVLTVFASTKSTAEGQVVENV